MKKLGKKISRRVLGIIPSLALRLAVVSASTICFYVLHQPDVPAELYDELKKSDKKT